MASSPSKKGHWIKREPIRSLTGSAVVGENKVVGQSEEKGGSPKNQATRKNWTQRKRIQTIKP